MMDVDGRRDLRRERVCSSMEDDIMVMGSVEEVWFRS
jgi:hypothetical protein